MSVEAQAVGKIIDGIKDLAKNLIGEQATTAGTRATYTVTHDAVHALIDAARDPEIWKHVPMGMARPVQNLLTQVDPGWDK